MIKAQSGNVLFLILIAVSLFAALSYAVTETGRGGSMDVNEQRAKVLAGEILVYMSSVEKMVQRALASGISESDICFDYDVYPGGNADYEHAGCATDEQRIFYASGGGVKWQEPAVAAMALSATPIWTFDASNRILEVGTDSANVNAVEMTMLLLNVSEAVCKAVNERAGVTAKDTAPPRDDVVMTTTPYIGSFTNASRIGDAANVLAGQQTACFEGGGTPATGTYHIYHVLNAR